MRTLSRLGFRTRSIVEREADHDGKLHEMPSGNQCQQRLQLLPRRALSMKNHCRKSVRVGLIGSGIQASRSPGLHESEAHAMGLSLTYQLIDLDQLGADVAALSQLLSNVQGQGFAGVNITHPCKQAVISLLDELSEDAAAIGAVNTVIFSSGKRIGYNTDCHGFAESFKRGLSDVVTNRVVLLGAGGAGAATAHAVVALGVKRLGIYDSEPARAFALAQQLTKRFGDERAVWLPRLPDLAAEMAEADGLIHATPSGMAGHPGMPLPIELLRSEQWVAEIVYFPLETELLRQARALSCRTLDGGGMAVFQAVEAFRLFTGLAPDPERMLRHFASIGTG